MNQYRGEVRRQNQPTPTKSTWENDRNNFQQVQQQKYSRNKDFEKSELSYYQSQVSHTVYDNKITQSRNLTQKLRTTSNQNKQLYDNLVPIKVQAVDREQYFTYLRIQIINTVQKGTGKLTLYLTDDRDPKFLWLFFIKQSDYSVLKREQNLRVEFEDFPAMLMDHFDMCKSQKEAMSSSKMGECCFFSLLEIKKTQGSLNILQANRYKNSVHLSLKCKLGNDQQVKQYLSQKLLKSQQQNTNLRSIISNLQQTLSTRKQQITRMQIELKKQIKTNEKSSQQFQLEITKIKTQMKRDKIESEEKIKKDAQKEYKDMKQGLDEQLGKYSKAYDEIKAKYEFTQEKIATLQSKQRQSSFDLSTKSKQIQTYTKRLQELKSYTVELQNNRTEMQKTIIQQKVRIQSLESQISDKLRIIQSTNELKSTNSHQINSLESKSQEYKRQVEKLEHKITTLQLELQKVNALYEDYREKYEKRKQKIQEKNNIIKQQQRYITDKENQINEVKRQLIQKETLVDEKKRECKEKDNKLGDMITQIEECQKKIKQDYDLVTHLQKQLNQRTIGIRSGYNTSTFQRTTSPYNSTVTNRQYINTNSSLGNTSTSRLKFTSTGDNNQEASQKGIPRKDIEIKRYTPTTNEQGFRERSKSPIINSRLNQQREPQEGKSGNNIVKPVKFKFSQRE